MNWMPSTDTTGTAANDPATTAAVPAPSQQPKLTGEIKSDGSSTVYLIAEAMAANLKHEHPDLRISVGISGTGGGFKKLCSGETDFSNASRTMLFDIHRAVWDDDLLAILGIPRSVLPDDYLSVGEQRDLPLGVELVDAAAGRLPPIAQRGELELLLCRLGQTERELAAPTQLGAFAARGEPLRARLIALCERLLG